MATNGHSRRRTSKRDSLLFILVVCLTGSSAAAGSLPLDDRLAGALWGIFVGDALAMPVHWYYGGLPQISRDFGGPLGGYRRASHPFPESIMQLSSTGGGGRGSDMGDIVGSVILHGKKDFWHPGGQYHYHHTLEPGENTLEASLARLLMRNLAKTGGSFSASSFRSAYVDFMTTPATHNDTYASTCHRMFFQRWHAGVPPEDCPANDGHNVDTIDGLVLPVVVLLVELGAGSPVDSAIAVALDALKVTRRSDELPPYVEALGRLLASVLQGSSLPSAAKLAARSYFGSDLEAEVARREADPIVACYIGGSFPVLLYFAYKYGDGPVQEALLASTNAGGENVHRGAVFGALVGAAAGEQEVPAQLRDGLFAHSELQQEIAALLRAVRSRREATARSADL